MKEIALTRGLVALVDDGDFETLNQFKWHAVKGRRVTYAARAIPSEKTRQTLVYMHREIRLDIPGKVDHIDGNGLNNQRPNLRPATSITNGQNRRKQTRGGTSKYKGVIWHKREQKWHARITIDKELNHLGSFPL